MIIILVSLINQRRCIEACRICPIVKSRTCHSLPMRFSNHIVLVNHPPNADFAQRPHDAKRLQALSWLHTCAASRGESLFHLLLNHPVPSLSPSQLDFAPGFTRWVRRHPAPGYPYFFILPSPLSPLSSSSAD